MTSNARAIIPFPESFVRRPQLRSEEALARIRRFLEDRGVPVKDKPGSFADFEKDLHAKVMEYERELIAEEMARADIDVGAIVVEGVTYRRASPLARMDPPLLAKTDPPVGRRALRAA